MANADLISQQLGFSVSRQLLWCCGLQVCGFLANKEPDDEGERRNMLINYISVFRISFFPLFPTTRESANSLLTPALSPDSGFAFISPLVLQDGLRRRRRWRTVQMGQCSKSQHCLFQNEWNSRGDRANLTSISGAGEQQKWHQSASAAVRGGEDADHHGETQHWSDAFIQQCRWAGWQNPACCLYRFAGFFWIK